MDVYETRALLKTKSIYELPLRVTYYARVSTDSEEQLGSLIHQQEYYKNLISKNNSWIFVNGYVDEGISGISTNKRESFQRMILDAKNDLFDLIITKEITRFARNTLDSIKYTRSLLDMGVGVFFQNDNINTLDEDSELRLTIMAGIAQDELRKLSSRIKFGHAQSIKNGVVLGNSRIFGYNLTKGKLTIDNYEASMVKTAFELYATDNYSMKNIEDILYEKGYRNHNGNKISHTTLSNMIKNPKYKGYYVGNKVRNINIFTGERKFLPEEEWVMYRDDNVPAIVSEELWAKANSVLSKRSIDVKNRQNKCNHDNLLTGKLICTHCGTPYYRVSAQYKGTNTSKWRCSYKIKNGKNACPSFTIKEEDIKKVIYIAFTTASDNYEKYINEYIVLLKSNSNTGCCDDEIKLIQSTIDKIEQKKDKVMELLIDGSITKKDFKEYNSRYNNELATANKQLEKAKDKKQKMNLADKKLEQIRKEIQEAIIYCKEHQTVTSEFVKKCIDKIEATPLNENSMSLKIFFKNGDITDTSINRSGNIFLVICPEQHIEITHEYRRKCEWKPQIEVLRYNYTLVIA